MSEKIRLLIIDDYPAVRLALRKRLEKFPHIKVISAISNSVEDLGVARKLQPDAILLELRGQCEFGVSLIRRLRRLVGRDAGIIVFTGYAPEGERQIALQAGAQRYLLKNINTPHLVSEIEAVALEMRKGSRQHKEIYKMKKEIVQDWMTPNPITITPDTPLPEIHRLLHNKQIRRLPVVNHGQLVGIITLGDVREAEPSDATSLSIWEINYLLAKLKAKQIMTPAPKTIEEEDTVGEAANLMLEHKIGSLPVLNAAGKLSGIITESDIFRMVVADWQKVDELENEPIYA